MDNTISAIVSVLCTPVVAPVYWQINHLFRAGANVKALKKEIDELKTAKGEVEQKIGEAAARTDEEVPTELVQKWLEAVRAVEVEVTRIEDKYNQRRLCFEWCAPNCWSNYNISKQAAAVVFNVKDLIAKEEKFDVVTIGRAPTVRRMPPMPEASPSVRSYLEKAFEYLEDDSAGMIGIYGMGGVGKTSLLRRINNHPFVAAAEFDYVIWLVASQDLNLNKLQNDMAERLGFRGLRDDATIEERGQSLYLFLKPKKFLLLLDDIWEPVDLEKLGITFPTSSSNGAPVRKVVFTTRSEGVCDRMMAGLKLCGRKVKVECMRREEAWQLFLDNVGHEARAISARTRGYVLVRREWRTSAVACH